MTTHDVYRVAVSAQIDPGTVFRYLKGIRVRDLSKLRIEAAIKRLRLKPEGETTPERRDETSEQQPA